MPYQRKQSQLLSEIHANLCLHKLDDIVSIKLVDGRITLLSFKYGTGFSYFCVPRGVEVLADSCFSGLELKVIRIDVSVKIIGYACFANCSDLKSIYVPQTLRSYEKAIGYGNDAKIVYF